jgi:hypothetical protein
VVEEMDLNILVRQLNNDNNNEHLHQIQIVDMYRLRMEVREKEGEVGKTRELCV